MDALPSSAGAEPPVHVAIIMDGNGRWAKARGLPRIAGHQRGAEAVRRVVSGAAELGIGYLTLYGFSSENWKRPPAEVDDLMQLLRLYLEREIATLHDNGIRLRIIGERDRFNPSIIALIDKAERLTAANRHLNLTMALSYGGRAEIAAAARRIAIDVAAGRFSAEAVDEALFARHLATADIPDPDTFLRALFYSSSGTNYFQFAEPGVDSLLDLAQRTADPGVRADAYRTVEGRIVAAAPLVPLFHSSTFVGLRDEVSGLEVNPLGISALAMEKLRIGKPDAARDPRQAVR